MHLQTPAIVLRSVDYKDADKILTVLTQAEGKRTVLARGCRRKGSRIAATSQLLAYSDMTLFAYKERLAMEEAAMIQEFRHLRQDIFSLALGAYFAEVTEAVAEEGRAEQALLSLLLNSLYALDTLKKPHALVKACFEARLVCITGYEPMLDGCVLCGEEDERGMFLELDEGGILCHNCVEPSNRTAALDLPALHAMQHAAYGDAKRLFSISPPPESLTRFSRAAEQYLLTQLDHSFRTLDYYHSLAAPQG